MTIEQHPLEPFLPANGQMLFLGSFPPPRARWSMEWFYPNWINDFWRIMGLIYFNDKTHFEIPQEKRFDREMIVQFCTQHGLAFFDTASKVCRLKDNASDNFLEILEPTDVFSLLKQMPQCHMVITTGGKASEELANYLSDKGIEVEVPNVGGSANIEYNSNDFSWKGVWFRMPSTSRAYPMKLEVKAEYYMEVLRL